MLLARSFLYQMCDRGFAFPVHETSPQVLRDGIQWTSVTVQEPLGHAESEEALLLESMPKTMASLILDRICNLYTGSIKLGFSDNNT